LGDCLCIWPIFCTLGDCLCTLGSVLKMTEVA
jgi:hypothetical protein